MNSIYQSVDLFSLIRDLCSISSPSGNEGDLCAYVKDLLANMEGVHTEVDTLGNVYIKKQGRTSNTIMLVAHCDEIGFAVKYIDDNGYIYFTPIGSVDPSILKGQRVSIKHDNSSINGVIGVQPIHLRKNARNKNIDIDFSDLWIDIGVWQPNQKISEYVTVGDPITFAPNYQDLENGLFSSKSIDNRTGVAVLLSVLQAIKDAETDYSIVFVFSVQEELGLRGARVAGYHINPDICIAVDVNHATDYPTIDKKKNGDIRLNYGCVVPIGANFNMGIQNELRTIAKQKNIAVQTESVPCYSGTDIADIQLSRGGVKTGLISIPCRYMHSPIEIASFHDIQSAIDIISNYCLCKTK